MVKAMQRNCQPMLVTFWLHDFFFHISVSLSWTLLIYQKKLSYVGTGAWCSFWLEIYVITVNTLLFTGNELVANLKKMKAQSLV